MNTIENQFVNIPKWTIKNYPDYYFCTNKKLHNLKTGRVIKKRVKCCSVGYELNGKFVILKKLKSMIVKIKNKSNNL